MLVVRVETDVATLQRAEDLLRDVPRGLPRVLARAVNKVAVGARAEIVNAVYEDIALTKREIRDRNVRLARANWSRPTAFVYVSGRRIPLFRFGANQTRRGVTYRIRRGGGRTALPGSFLATMKSGHRGVFVRKAAGGKRVARFPITERYGPSVPGVVGNVPEMAADVMNRRLAARLDGEIDRQIGVLLTQRAEGGT